MHVESKNLQIDIFGNTPLLDAWWKEHDTKTRLLSIVLVTWMPLVILSAISGHALSGERNEAMLWDAAIHMRLLVALPLLLMSSLKSSKRLRPVFDQFITADILDPSEYVKFEYEIKETMRLRDSKFAKNVLFVLMILLVATAIYLTYGERVVSWRMIDGKTTMAGWWYNLVSQPILVFTMLYFLYRATLWSRILLKIAQMKLQIKAFHGDGCGGLGFLGHSLEIFIVPVFAISASLAGGLMNLVLHADLELQGMKLTLAVLLMGLFVLFVFPLFFFFPVLKEAKAKGILEYGILTGKQLTAFRNKWMRNEDPQDANILQDEDFQTIDSNNGVMEKVHSMKPVPVGIKDLAPLLVAALIPFIPVLALKVPWNVIFEQLTKVVM